MGVAGSGGRGARFARAARHVLEQLVLRPHLALDVVGQGPQRRDLAAERRQLVVVLLKHVVVLQRRRRAAAGAHRGGVGARALVSAVDGARRARPRRANEGGNSVTFAAP